MIRYESRRAAAADRVMVGVEWLWAGVFRLLRAGREAERG